MTVFVSHVAAVPGPVLQLAAVAAFAVGGLAWRAWNRPAGRMVDCWRLVADGWPRHVRVIHDEPGASP